MSGLTWQRVREVLTNRWVVKGAFFAYFVFACVQLMRFLAFLKDEGPAVGRPEVVAGMLPVGHFTSFFAWLRGGGWDTLLPAGLVIILAAITLSLLFKRGFCGWICPVGTLWEGFSAVGRRLLKGRQVRIPKGLDIAGRIVRYVITAAIVAFLLMVPVAEAVDFRSLPYMSIADIKILSIMLEPTYLLVALFAGVLTVLFGPIWCRYLCPLGGLYSTIALLSPFKVVRSADPCTHCRKCSNTCHAFIDVEKKTAVRDTECDGCMECVRACPAEGALEAKGPGGIKIAPWVWIAVVVAIWLGIFSAAKLTGNWDTTITTDQFRAAVQSGILDRASVPQRNGQ
jgi:ferredoxin